jgi:adenosylcobinamide-GDP ribazoletransferase
MAALQFLTIVPPIIRRLFTEDEMGRAVGFFPLVGALLGGLLAALDRGLTQILPGEVAAALTLGAWVYLTGALHLDGFLDACDGLFGGHTPEDRLLIMRDERIGAFAMAGGGVLLIVKYAALAHSPDRLAALLLAATLSRWTMSGAIVLAPYARPQGLGRAIKDHAGWQQVVVATVVALAVAWLAKGWLGLAAALLAAAAARAAARFALKRLPGLTGDIYGAICELIETLVLVLMTALPT